MQHTLETSDIAGGVVAVVKDGAVIFEKGYGYADVATRKPVDPKTTLFRPGSVSKLFTWTAVMQLVEQGKLNLDQDVNSYLDFKIPARPDGPITLRNIMTHTAGFEEQDKSLITSDPKALVSLREYVTRATPARIFKAGSTPAYSNYATAVAAYIVERVSGEKFDDYIEAHIFQPLGMKQATFRQPLPQRFVADMSQGYKVASQPAEPYELVVGAPAGSLAASADDMAKFMIAHLQNGEYQGNRILLEKTAKTMHDTATDMIPPLNRMLLGFYEQNYNGHRVASHGGDTQFMHTYLHLFPDDGVGLFMSFNSVGREGAGGDVRSALFSEFADRYFPSQPKPGVVSADVAAAHARLMSGYYEVSRRADRAFIRILALLSPVEITADKDNQLAVSLIKAPNRMLRKYREVEPFVWRDINSQWRVAAKVDNGHVVRFSMDQVSPFMVFEPMPWWRSAAWLRPAAITAFLACLLTAILWPVGAVVRRRLRAPIALAGEPRRAWLHARLATVVVSVVTLAWFTLFTVAMSDASYLSPSLDPILIVLYSLSFVGYIGSAAVLARSAYVTCTCARPWTVRLWSVVLAVSGLVLLWVAYTYHLMSFVTQY